MVFDSATGSHEIQLDLHYLRSKQNVWDDFSIWSMECSLREDGDRGEIGEGDTEKKMGPK